MQSNYDPLYKPFYCYLTRHDNKVGVNAELREQIARLVWKAKQELDTRAAYNVPLKLYNEYSEALQKLTEQIEPGSDNRETLKLAEQARKYLDKRMLYRVRVKSRVY